MLGYCTGVLVAVRRNEVEYEYSPRTRSVKLLSKKTGNDGCMVRALPLTPCKIPDQDSQVHEAGVPVRMYLS